MKRKNANFGRMPQNWEGRTGAVPSLCLTDLDQFADIPAEN